MIIIGYPGVGKTTLAVKRGHVIDLETSNFFVNGERSRDWAKIYANIAVDLSSQGKDVFVSSHYAVREELFHKNVMLVALVPSLGLKDKWIEKLKKRYEETRLTKDEKALTRAAEYYELDIKNLLNDSRIDIIIEINSMDYNLDIS